MSRHRNVKYMAEDAIDNMDWEGGYDYYGEGDPDLFGRLKLGDVNTQIARRKSE